MINLQSNSSGTISCCISAERSFPSLFEFAAYTATPYKERLKAAADLPLQYHKIVKN